MIAHHHLNGRRLIRVFIFIWTLLLLLVLLPIRAHGQEILETAPRLQTQLAALFAAETLFLFVVIVSYVLMRAHAGDHRRVPPRS